MVTANRAARIAAGTVALASLLALWLVARAHPGEAGAAPAYRVQAEFQNVGSLRPGAPVTLGGVPVGRVAALDYDQDYFVAIVTLEVDARYDRIPADTQASVFSAGLLGAQYVGLEPGGERRYLKEQDTIRTTQSALVLERIIGRFLFGAAGGNPNF